GCVLAGIICLGRAFYFYFTAQQDYFFYEDLSYFMHPSYFSMYVNLAVFFILRDFFRRESGHKTWNMFLFIFLTLIIFLLSSKLGIISYFLLSGLFLFIELFRRKKHLLLAAIFGLGIAGFFSVYTFSSTMRTRFDYMFSAVNSESINKADQESSAVRVLIWGEAKKIIAQNLLIGVSPGDANDRLYKAYEENGITGALQNKLNAHNQYFQTFIGLGLAGFLLLISQFIFPFIHAVRQGKTMYMLFILLIVMNLLVESMFQTQAGVLFYAFFNSLFLFHTETGPEGRLI
ncbi:MAG: O-antigen ligase family protein, partial [Bacteroidia bacterium]